MRISDWSSDVCSSDLEIAKKEVHAETRRRGGIVRDIDVVSGDVLDLSLRLHRELGPGLLESVYETVLAGKLIERGYRVDRQMPVDIHFEGARFDAAFRIDLLVDGRLLLEIKSVELLNAALRKQLFT